MTHNEFKALVAAIINNEGYVRALGTLPEQARACVYILFMAGEVDSERANTVREQLAHLESHGVFHFTD